MAKFDKIAVMQKIGDTGMVPVFYHKDLEVCKNVVKACYEGGVRADKKHLTDDSMKTAELVESQMDGTASTAHDVETLAKNYLQSMRRLFKAYDGD